MNEKLISGYAAYTTADEYSADAVGDAPATPIASVALSIASAAFSANTVTSNC